MKLDDFDKKKPKKIITIFSGGFHIFSPGHKACWDFLVKEFPTADHFIASSNVITDRPFTFPQKRFLAAQAGIPPKQFIQVKSPYKLWKLPSIINQKIQFSSLVFLQKIKNDLDQVGKKMDL